MGGNGEDATGSPADPRAEAREAVAAWLARVKDRRDPTVVLEPDAARDARRLTELLGGDQDDLHSQLFLGWLHFYRFQVLPSGQRKPDLDAATTMLTPCFMSSIDLDQLPSPLLPVLAQEGTPTLGLLMHGLATADLQLVSTLVDMWRRVLAATPAGHPARAEWLSDLGAALQDRFRRTGAATDLDEAIAARREALTAFTDTEPARAEWLSNLGTDPQDLFRQADAAADLDEAIAAGRDALAPFADTELDRATMLSNLGNALNTRFRQSAAKADLDEAIQITQEAAQATSAHHPGRTAILANLAKVLVSQYERTGAPTDLDEAIRMGQEAAAAASDHHPDRTAILANLAYALLSRFQRTDALTDLDETIRIGRKTVASTPHPEADRGVLLSNLGAALRVRFERTGLEADLDEAIRVGREAVSNTPTGRPDRAAMLANLEIALRIRLGRTGTPADLAETIQVALSIESAQPIPGTRPRTANPPSRPGATSVAARVASEVLDQRETDPRSGQLGRDETAGRHRSAQRELEAVSELIQHGQLDEAQARLTAALDRLSNPGDIAEQGLVLLQLAQVEHRRGHHGEAIALGRRAIRASYSAAERLNAADAHASMANFLASGSRQDSAEASVHILAAAVIHIREAQEQLSSGGPLPAVRALLRLTFCLARQPQMIPESIRELQQRLQESTDVDIGQLLAGLRRICIAPEDTLYGVRFLWAPDTEYPGDSVTDALCWANRRPPPQELTDVEGHPRHWQPIIDAVTAGIGDKAAQARLNNVLDDYRGSGWSALADTLNSLMTDPRRFTLPPSLQDAERMIIQRILVNLG